MDWVVCLAFSHDGNRVVSGEHHGTIQIWDPATGKCTVSTQSPGGSRVSPLGYRRSQILDPIDQEVISQASFSTKFKRLQKQKGAPMKSGGSRQNIAKVEPCGKMRVKGELDAVVSWGVWCVYSRRLFVWI